CSLRRADPRAAEPCAMDRVRDRNACNAARLNGEAPRSSLRNAALLLDGKKRRLERAAATGSGISRIPVVAERAAAGAGRADIGILVVVFVERAAALAREVRAACSAGRRRAAGAR